MYNIWIIVLCLGLLATKPINVQSEFDVQLVLPRYVERGAKATLQCRHNVRPEVLFKVTWIKVDSGKFFEFINGRNPPFRNFTLDGGEIDWENSNETQVTLKNVDFDLSGQFFCEVSKDRPIYTKPSADELMSVFVPQTGPPIIKFRKRAPFVIGERLLALCNTTRARPAPHITWLINGKKVEEKYVRTHHVPSTNGKTRRTQHPIYTQQLYQQQIMPQQYQQFHPQSTNLNQYQHAQFHPGSLIDRYDKSLRYSGRHYDDFIMQTAQNQDGLHYSTSLFNNPFGALTNIHEAYDIQERNFDHSKHLELKKRLEMKKHHEMKKQRNAASHKSRRHINENALGIIRSTLNSGGFGPQPPNINNAGPMSQLASTYQRPISHPGGGMGVAAAAAAVTAAQLEKGMYSLSQLNIDLTEQHMGTNGRMEITCLSTIPSAVVEGEQYADYKTYSVKVELVRPDTLITTTMSNTIGVAAIVNGVGSETSSADKPYQRQQLVQLILTVCGVLQLFRY